MSDSTLLSHSTNKSALRQTIFTAVLCACSDLYSGCKGFIYEHLPLHCLQTLHVEYVMGGLPCTSHPKSFEYFRVSRLGAVCIIIRMIALITTIQCDSCRYVLVVDPSHNSIIPSVAAYFWARSRHARPAGTSSYIPVLLLAVILHATLAFSIFLFSREVVHTFAIRVF